MIHDESEPKAGERITDCPLDGAGLAVSIQTHYTIPATWVAVARCKHCGMTLKTGFCATEELARQHIIEKANRRAGDAAPQLPIQKSVDELHGLVEKALCQVMENREEIVRAFIAKYGRNPAECEQVLQTRDDGSIAFWIQKRTGRKIDEAGDAEREEATQVAHELEYWKKRFRAIVGKDFPDSAGNEVIVIMAERDKLAKRVEELEARGTAYDMKDLEAAWYSVRQERDRLAKELGEARAHSRSLTEALKENDLALLAFVDPENITVQTIHFIYRTAC